MEIFILVLFAVPILFIICIVSLFNLTSSNHYLARRLDIIEEQLRNGVQVKNIPSQDLAQSGVALKDASAYGFQNQEKLQRINESRPLMENYNTNIGTNKEEPNRFTTWLKEDWLMKLGAFLFILGFGWFVSYAFANNWVGPIGRISIGIVAGILIMAFGFKWMMKYVSQGAVFMSLGAGMAILTIFAGRAIYGFFTPASAIAFDFLIVAFVSFASYKFNIKSLAMLAQVLAFVTPLLVAGGSDSVFLFFYLFFISLATLFLAGVTGWRDLITSSLIFVGLYSLPYMSSYNNDAPVILNFAYMFSLLYLLSGMFAVIRKGIQSSTNEVTLAVLNGLFIFLWINNVASKDWIVIIFAVWAIIFAVSSFMTLRFSKELAPFYSYGSIAVAFIAAATAAQLSGVILTIVFILEILFLVVIVFSLTNNMRATTTTALLFMVPMYLSLGSLARFSYSKFVLTEDFFVLVLLAFSLLFVGRFLVQNNPEKKESKDFGTGSVFLIMGILYLGYIVWCWTHIVLLATPDMATLVALLIFTIVGLISYFNGLSINDLARRTYGMVLVGFVVIRLLLIDVWNMELFGRVVTFLAIGVLLMSTAFITKKKKNENIIA